MPRPLGYKLSDITKEKIRKALKGRILMSPDALKRMSETKKGIKYPWMYGNNFGSKNRGKIGLSGQNSPHWIKDRSLIKKQEERNNPNDKQWKYSVYKRDNWKCKINNSNCNGRLEAHHILSWRDYPELRYDINNGITLCLAHHPRKRAEEKRLSPFFMELVSVSKD